MKKLSIVIATATLLLFALGCDKIDNPHKPYTPTGGEKTVLIKDFTGVRCVNCPEAAETAHELQHRLGEDRVFILSVHAGYLATALGQFTDFTTEEGDLWYADHDANPLFSVDHVALTEGNTYNVDQIDTPVSDALSEAQTFSISTENIFDEASRQLTVKPEVKAVSDVTGDFYVTVCLVEDSIVGWQVIPGGVDKEYVFRNVFRGTINGVDGELFNSGQVFVNDEKTFNYSLELDTIYNADQCYIMTYVYDKADGKIMQTAVEKVK